MRYRHSSLPSASSFSPYLGCSVIARTTSGVKRVTSKCHRTRNFIGSLQGCALILNDNRGYVTESMCDMMPRDRRPRVFPLTNWYDGASSLEHPASVPLED